MAYTVIWTEKALKNLKQLPQKTAARIVTSVEKIRDSPLDHLYPLQGSPYYKLRVRGYPVVILVRVDGLRPRQGVGSVRVFESPLRGAGGSLCTVGRTWTCSSPHSPFQPHCFRVGWALDRRKAVVDMKKLVGVA